MGDPPGNGVMDTCRKYECPDRDEQRGVLMTTVTRRTGGTGIFLMALGCIQSACAPDASPVRVHRLAEMNTDQIRALDRDRTVILVPGGIMEEHGPYLPSYADGYQNERYTADIAAAIARRPGWAAVIFPTIPLERG